jgi:aspartyl protease family protein
VKLLFLALSILFVSVPIKSTPTAIFQGAGEGYNLEETLEYINSQLSKNYIEESSESYYMHKSYSVKIKDGQLLIRFIGVSATGYKLSNRQKTIIERVAPIDAISKPTVNCNGELLLSKYINTQGIGLSCKDAAYCFIEKAFKYDAYDKLVETETKTIKSTSIGFSNEMHICGNLLNAFLHLIEIAQKEPNNLAPRYVDPFATPKTTDLTLKSMNTTPTNNVVIKMVKRKDDIYEIPVEVNGVLKINFIFDSGASDVSVAPDVASTLIKTGTVSVDDFVGTQEYLFADGTTASSKVFVLKSLKIGSKIVYNVRASISNSIDAPMLLGQSVLQRFGRFSIDNNAHTITID